ncbi:MAG: transcription elongation factor GreA [Bacteroidetes bacterium]|jgi:transcription elongation factor GreA|nr:transcription elongation factor GreA [Bacteroidota bacterium]MBT6684747.1 transcription elongation factor GreA [Bacteroidota bacterium]MBT7143848.1 transcription elongation factor GreA [Bacteroidota bacterium]MBT7489971.1 transcription elongation factor GreA [Bacteroidota bacterium]
MANISYITEEGLKKLKEDLDHLTRVERPNISKQIAEARDKGDLSENAEYDAAKEAQGMLEMKISKLQNSMSGLRIIDESTIDTSKVQIFSKVNIQNKKNNSLMEYTIVSESEANIKEKKISVSTPIAKALLGHKVGDCIDIKVPSGIIQMEIVNISK